MDLPHKVIRYCKILQVDNSELKSRNLCTYPYKNGITLLVNTSNEDSQRQRNDHRGYSKICTKWGEYNTYHVQDDAQLQSNQEIPIIFARKDLDLV